VVQAFRAGRQNATDQPRPGRPSAKEAQVSSVATLLETSHSVPHSLTEIQKWQRYESARMHLERYKKKEDAFLHRIIALDEAWA